MNRSDQRRYYIIYNQSINRIVLDLNTGEVEIYATSKERASLGMIAVKNISGCQISCQNTLD